MRKTLLAFGISAFALTACAPTPKLSEPKGLPYIAEHPMRLDLDRIEVVKAYTSPGKLPNVEHQFPVPPAALVQQWVQDRLLPIGHEDYAVVTIEDASVIETPLPRTGGMSGWFTVDQTERYDASLKVKVEIFDRGGHSRGFASAASTGSQTVTENMTLGQRRKVWVDLMEKVMTQLDTELESNIKVHLGSFVRS